MSSRSIYLDNAATTAVDPRVIEEMSSSASGADGDFANPSAVEPRLGRRAGARVERARAEVAALVGCRAGADRLFTSGATEANNLALLGAARFHRDRGRHLVTSRTEHPAVLDACRQLEREGFAVTYLKPGPDGIVEPAQVAAALRPDTLLVSLMHVNNEIGVVKTSARSAALCRARGVLFHVDAAQSAGKLPIDVRARLRSTCCRSPRTRCTVRRASVRCASAASRASGWCRCSSAAARSAGCVPARCRRTRSSAGRRVSHRARGDGADVRAHRRPARAALGRARRRCLASS